MKVVITGGLGKAGQWVIKELQAHGDGHGYRVIVFDRARGAEKDVHYIEGDVQDLGQVYGALAGADAVLHLAGVPTHSITSNEVVFRTNVIGTFNIHEAASRLGVRRVVTMGSEAVLGWAPNAASRESYPDYFPIDENHPLNPQDAYGLSKKVAESIAQSFTDKCNLETTVLRPPWIVSPEELEVLRKTGGIEPTRFALFHYIDVRDCARACRLALERPLSGHHAFFLGSGESCVAEPLADVYKRLAPAIAQKAGCLTGSQASVSVDCAKRVLDWAPLHSWRS